MGRRFRSATALLQDTHAHIHIRRNVSTLYHLRLDAATCDRVEKICLHNNKIDKMRDSLQFRSTLATKRKFEPFHDRHGHSDWLCSAYVKFQVLKKILELLPKKKDASIFLPGISKSYLGSTLLDNGYSNITVADVDPENVSETNRKLFENKIKIFDLLSNFQLNESFDCIIDSSVTDVFTGMDDTRGSFTINTPRDVHNKLLNLLKPDGFMVVFSMNNEMWDKIYQGNRYKRKHIVIRPVTTVRTRGGRITFKTNEDVLVLVASQQDTNLDMLEIPEINEEEGRIVGEWEEALPEDWNNQRD